VVKDKSEADQMEIQRIIELAIETLERQKSAIDAEIAQLRGTGKAAPVAPRPGKRRTRTAAEKKAQSKRMKAYWTAKRKAATPEVKSAMKAAEPARGPKSAAARKAQSEGMKRIWAERRIAQAAKPAPAKGPQSDAARKALSEKAKAVWAKRKAEAAKKGK
jgi:hypothetical protein